MYDPSDMSTGSITCTLACLLPHWLGVAEIQFEQRRTFNIKWNDFKPQRQQDCHIRLMLKKVLMDWQPAAKPDQEQDKLGFAFVRRIGMEWQL